MKLTVLGFSPPYPNPNKATSAFLLETEVDRVLIDCGHGAAGKLLEKIDPSNLTAIIISHMHPDHFYDLIPLRNVFFKRKLKKIPLYMPPEGSEILNDVVKATRLPSNYIDDHFIVSEYDPDKQITLGSFTIDMIKTIHPINTYAMSIQHKNASQKIVYTSDTAIFPKLADFCRNASLLLIECTDHPVPNDQPQRWHLSPEEVAKVMQESKPELTIITHYESDKKKDIAVIVENETKNIHFEMAEELKEFII